MRMIVLAAVAAVAVVSPAVLPFAGDVIEKAEECAERYIGAASDPLAAVDDIKSADDLYDDVSEQLGSFVSCVKRTRHPAFKRAPS